MLPISEEATHVPGKNLPAAISCGLRAQALPAARYRPIRRRRRPMRRIRAALCHDVKLYGATGDGKTIDTPAVNRAIEAANAAGGGTVRFPAGNYLCYSIRLKSNVALYLDQNAPSSPPIRRLPVRAGTMPPSRTLPGMTTRTTATTTGTTACSGAKGWKIFRSSVPDSSGAGDSAGVTARGRSPSIRAWPTRRSA